MSNGNKTGKKSNKTAIVLIEFIFETKFNFIMLLCFRLASTNPLMHRNLFMLNYSLIILCSSCTYRAHTIQVARVRNSLLYVFLSVLMD